MATGPQMLVVGTAPTQPEPNSWAETFGRFDAALAGQALAEEARLAFRLTADILRCLPALSEQRPDANLVRDCLRFAAPMARPRPGLVRVLYFPTRPGQLPEFFVRLIFYVLFARANGHDGAVAWLSFPLMLLGAKNQADIIALVSAIGAACRTGDAQNAGALTAAGHPVSISFEPDARVEATLHLGAHRPAVWDNLPISPFMTSHGLPMVCIPSRSTTEVAISEVPWLDPAEVR